MNHLDQRVSELRSQRPSALNLVALTEISRYELTPDGRVELLSALEKHASWLASQIHEVTYLISLDQPGREGDGAFEGMVLMALRSPQISMTKSARRSLLRYA